MGLRPEKAAGFFLIGAGVGVISGYLYAEHSLKREYEALASEEIAEAREYYSRLTKKDDYATPAKAVEKIIPQVVTNSLREYSSVDHSPFCSSQTAWNDLLRTIRSLERPTTKSGKTSSPVFVSLVPIEKKSTNPPLFSFRVNIR